MKQGRIWATGLLVALSIAAVVAAKIKPRESTVADEQRRAIHAVHRLTFGPVQGQVESVAKLGVDNWIELQLHPEKIDDSALQQRLAQYRTLQMTTREIALNFPPNPLSEGGHGRESGDSQAIRTPRHIHGRHRAAGRKEGREAERCGNLGNSERPRYAETGEQNSSWRITRPSTQRQQERREAHGSD